MDLINFRHSGFGITHAGSLYVWVMRKIGGNLHGSNNWVMNLRTELKANNEKHSFYADLEKCYN